MSANREAVNHPAHYGGAENPYEAIKVIEAWGLGFCLGNTVKYIARAGRKASVVHGTRTVRSAADMAIEDLEKASWYLLRELDRLKKERDLAKS